MSESGQLTAFQKFRQLLEMIRFSHTLFALPFALMAAILAWNTSASHHPVEFQWLHLFAILLAMVGARSAAMAFNRLVDRKIDAGNERTRNRHLPSGQISVASTVRFILTSIGVYLIGSALFLPNWLPLAVATPVLAVLLGYSYTKRFTSLAHFWLGAALALAPICAWIAIRGQQVIANPVDLTPAVVLGAAVMFWVSGFDMIYACQDFEFDRQAGLNSIPVLLGIAGSLRLAAICHLVMLILLAAIPAIASAAGLQLGLGWIYYAGVAGIALLLAYEHALVQPNSSGCQQPAIDLTRINVAFFNVNAIVSIGLFLLTAVDLAL